MDPSHLLPGQWDRIARLLVDLTVFVGLALNAAFAFLLGRVVLPAVDGPVGAAATGYAAGGSGRLARLALYPIAALSTAALLFALGRALVQAADVLRDVYPRFLI